MIMQSEQTQPIETKRIAIFLLFAFGIAWATAWYIYNHGGLTGGAMLAPGVPLAVVLLAGPYMFAPTIGHLAARLLSGEGWHGLTLWPKFRTGWKFWLAGWFLPGVLTVAGAVVFFVIFPSLFDADLKVVQNMGVMSGFGTAGLAPWQMLMIGMLMGMLLAPINLLATFGEEFGWRAYLLQKLLPMGRQKALLVMGLIWGVWHWPVIFMGYEYGSNYPGWPWVGPLLFVWITFGLGTFLAWLAIRSGSVWPAALGHAAINAIAGLSLLVVNPSLVANPLYGPSPVGVLGGIGYSLVALYLFVTPSAWQEPAAPRL